MISNILMGLGICIACFLGGVVTGALGLTKAVVKVDKMYKEKTGNSFVKWVFDESANVNKHRVEVLYAAE